jgi:uncharacterized protein YjiS (DUF1127 family)
MRTLFRPRLGDRYRFDQTHGGALGIFGHGLTLWRTAMRTRRERRALLALDDRMLSDIGLSRSQAYREATKSITDLPGR